MQKLPTFPIVSAIVSFTIARDYCARYFGRPIKASLGALAACFAGISWGFFALFAPTKFFGEMLAPLHPLVLGEPLALMAFSMLLAVSCALIGAKVGARDARRVPLLAPHLAHMLYRSTVTAAIAILITVVRWK